MSAKPAILRNFVWRQREARIELTVERDGQEYTEVINLEDRPLTGGMIRDLFRGIGKPLDELFKEEPEEDEE